MNVFTFQHRFERPILDGIKDSTIRAPRKDGRPRARTGEMISLRVWSGAAYRSPQREFAQRVVKFTFPVRVSNEGFTRLDNGEPLVRTKMARSLGFASWVEARDWYRNAHGLPFDGVLVHFPES